MKIDYTGVITNFMGSKVGYFGFKYDEGKSDPATGSYEFTRHYWGALESVAISRVEYGEEDLEGALRDGDVPTEVPAESLPIKEPGYRLWLSQKYIRAGLRHDRAYAPIPPAASGSATYDETSRLAWERPYWWEFSNTSTLKLRLNEIYERIVSDGLEWYERQVAEIRRYHDKLDLRRAAAAKKLRDR